MHMKMDNTDIKILKELNKIVVYLLENYPKG